jgi:hypothetical protein
MLKTSRLAALLIAGAIISAPAFAQSKTFATVNGQAIPQSVYDAFVAEQKAQGTPDTPELQNAVKEELIRREILAQEAKKKGLDKKGNIQGQVELAKQAVLIRAFLSDYVAAHPISEAQLKAEYDVIKTNLGTTEYKARHILVADEEEAKASSPSSTRARSSPSWPRFPRIQAPRTKAANSAGAPRIPTSSRLARHWPSSRRTNTPRPRSSPTSATTSSCLKTPARPTRRRSSRSNSKCNSVRLSSRLNNWSRNCVARPK